MSDTIVSCPNCGANVIFDPKTGTDCGNCFQHLQVAEYIGISLRKMGYATSFGTSLFQNTITVSKSQKEIGEISFDLEVGYYRLTVANTKSVEDIISLLVSTNLKTIVKLTEIEARKDSCPVCNGELSYFQILGFGFGGGHYIGCIKESHIFVYIDVETWLGSTLSEHYQTFHFEKTDTALEVKNLEYEKTHKHTLFSRNPPEVGVYKSKGFIRSKRNGDILAIWVPKSLLPAVIDILGYLSRLNIKNIKIVSVNN